MTRSAKLFWRAIRIAIAVAAVLYGGAQAGIRSPWFRVAVERRLSNLAGMEVRVGRIRPTESLNLRISDVSSLENNAGMEVRVLRVKWSFFAPRGFFRVRKLVAEDAVLTMSPDAAGNMQPAFAGNRAWEMVGHLSRGLEPDIRRSPDLPGSGDNAGDAPTGIGRGFASMPDFRLLRCVFSLRDANGRERVSAKDVEINRTVGLDADGRPEEHWEVQAAVLSVEGMQLTGIDWVADRTVDGEWKVARFASSDWSGWTATGEGSDVEDATEKYRALLDSI